MSAIVGTDLDDSLIGTDGNDSIFGRAGNDQISGLNGKDLLNGGNGNDSLRGGYGSDFLNGEAGDDFLEGEFDNDKLYGGDGSDGLVGGTGNDILNGGNGHDRLNGTGGVDGLNSGKLEIDTLTGKAGNDVFILSSSYRTLITPSYVGNGNSDYALITDFDKSKDVVFLPQKDTGAVDTFIGYSLGASPNNLPKGTAVFANYLGAQPDLIAILQGVSPNSTSLSEPYFQIQ